MVFISHDHKALYGDTPRKINIEPENDGLIQMIFLYKEGPYSQVPAVNLPGCILKFLP